MKKVVLCDYGCGREGKFKFKNGKVCCSKRASSCPGNKKRSNFNKPFIEPDKSIRNGYECRGCREWKPWSEFVDEKNKKGVFVFCKSCRH